VLSRDGYTLNGQRHTGVTYTELRAERQSARNPRMSEIKTSRLRRHGQDKTRQFCLVRVGGGK